jgi:hypothetical protein
MDRSLVRVAAGLALAALLAVPVGGLLAQPRPEVTPQERTLTVSGQGSVHVPASEANFTLGVQETSPTAAAAQRTVREQLNRLVDRLKSLEVRRLQTASIQVYASGTPPMAGRPEQRRFTASSTLTFTVPVEQAGAVLDASFASGANTVQGVSFDISDQVRERARSQALERAVADARSQGDVVLKSLGLSARGIRSVQIGSSGRPGPVPLAAMARAEVGPTPIQGGEVEVEANVTLEIGY